MGHTKDNNESNINGQGTSLRDNNETGNEDGSMSFFSCAKGEGDYAVGDFTVQQGVAHFLCNQIDNSKNSPNMEICLLVEAQSPIFDEKATTTDMHNG